DLHVDELADEGFRAVEIERAVARRLAAELAGAPRGLFHQNLLRRADQLVRVLVAQFADARLQALQPLLLHFEGNVVAQVRRRCAGTRAVDEGVGRIDPRCLDQGHGQLEVLCGLRREADDEIRGQGQIGARLAQPADLVQV
ncbi:hypothetical protein AFK76_12755, partial [Idiomarina zobellii]